jgi:hypothetical protein
MIPVEKSAASMEKRPAAKPLYDDDKIESILHYYGIEDDLGSLLRYIKNRGIIDNTIE